MMDAGSAVDMLDSGPDVASLANGWNTVLAVGACMGHEASVKMLLVWGIRQLRQLPNPSTLDRGLSPSRLLDTQIEKERKRERDGMEGGARGLPPRASCRFASRSRITPVITPSFE